MYSYLHLQLQLHLYIYIYIYIYSYIYIYIYMYATHFHYIDVYICIPIWDNFTSAAHPQQSLSCRSSEQSRCSEKSGCCSCRSRPCLSMLRGLSRVSAEPLLHLQRATRLATPASCASTQLILRLRLNLIVNISSHMNIKVLIFNLNIHI